MRSLAKQVLVDEERQVWRRHPKAVLRALSGNVQDYPRAQVQSWIRAAAPKAFERLYKQIDDPDPVIAQRSAIAILYWCAGKPAMSLEDVDTGKFQDVRALQLLSEFLAGLFSQPRMYEQASGSTAHRAGTPSPQVESLPTTGLGDGPNGHATPVDTGQVQRGASEPERVSGPVGAGALQDGNHNGGAVDTGHPADPWGQCEWDGSLHRDIQSHSSDSEEPSSDDKNGAGKESTS